MSGCELAGILHVILQAPELPQTDIGNVDNVAGLRDGGLGVCTIGESRAQGKCEVDQVLVEGKQAQHLLGHLGGEVDGRVLRRGGRLVRSDGL